MTCIKFIGSSKFSFVEHRPILTVSTYSDVDMQTSGSLYAFIMAVNTLYDCFRNQQKLFKTICLVRFTIVVVVAVVCLAWCAVFLGKCQTKTLKQTYAKNKNVLKLKKFCQLLSFVGWNFKTEYRFTVDVGLGHLTNINALALVYE